MCQPAAARDPTNHAATTKTQTPFHLMRYFAAVSLVMIVLLVVGAGLFTARSMRDELIKQGEENAVRVAQHLGAELHHRFDSPLDLHALMTHPDEAAKIQDDLHSLAVERVKIYDTSGVIVYSDVAALIGVDDSENLYVQNALAGHASSKFVQAQRAADVTDEPGFAADVLETYVPLRGLSGSDQVIGVVEIYQDTSSIRQQLRRMEVRIVTIATLMAVLLFLSLLGLIYRADRIIKQQLFALQQANIEMSALQQAKDDLVHMVVHDLKNPLTTILLSLTTLLQSPRDPLSERQARVADRALQSSEHLLAMTHDLLDVTRLEEGHLLPQIESLRLMDVLAEATDSPAHIAQAKGQTLALNLSDGLPSVLADRDLLHRVLDNLLSNALKYTETLIEISAAPHAESGYVQITIHDDGPGIPLELQEAIFDRFVQARAADARIGTGLGLAFCKLAVEAHGGRIWVESEMGQGARFVFTIPTVQVLPSLSLRGTK